VCDHFFSIADVTRQRELFVSYRRDFSTSDVWKIAFVHIDDVDAAPYILDLYPGLGLLRNCFNNVICYKSHGLIDDDDRKRLWTYVNVLRRSVPKYVTQDRHIRGVSLNVLKHSRRLDMVFGFQLSAWETLVCSEQRQIRYPLAFVYLWHFYHMANTNQMWYFVSHLQNAANTGSQNPVL